MMRSVTIGLGALTVLAVAGAMTAPGQSMLGFGRAAQDTSSVTEITDTAATAPAPAAAPRVAAATPVPAGPAHVASAPPAPARQPTPRPAAGPAPAARAAPPQGGSGTSLGLATAAAILLILPQILLQPHPAEPGRPGRGDKVQPALWPVDQPGRGEDHPGEKH